MVVPTYTLNPSLEKMAEECLLSYRKYVDELIVVEDGGMVSEKLAKIADHYFYHKENYGFTKNVNFGWKKATGDFVMIVNSDTLLSEGEIESLCIPGKVTSPIIENQNIPNLAGPFWCASREAIDKYGYLWESMKTYYSDSEYDNRVRADFVKVPSVKIYHHQAQTVTAAGVEGKVDADRAVYQSIMKA